MAPPIPLKESSLQRKTWSPEEDSILIDYIKTHGEGHWASLPVKAGLKRRGKSCRLRWFNYLRPSIKRGKFSADEEELLVRLHRLLGNRWSLIAKRLPGRTDNDVKNFWNTQLCKKRRGNNNAIPTISPFHNTGASTDYYWNTITDKKVQQTNDSANGETVTKPETCEKGNDTEIVFNSCEGNRSMESIEEESYREAIQHLQSQEWPSIYSPFPCAEFAEHDPLLMETNSDMNYLSYPDSTSPLLSTGIYDSWGSL